MARLEELLIENYDFLTENNGKECIDLAVQYITNTETVPGHEVKEVLAMNPSRSAMQAIGYKELKRHLEGEYPFEEAGRLIKRNTKRYAKRQFTWFRKEEDLNWMDITGAKGPDEAVEKLQPLLPAEIFI